METKLYIKFEVEQGGNKLEVVEINRRFNVFIQIFKNIPDFETFKKVV